MPIFREKDWIKDLPDGFTIYFYLKTFLGQIVSFSVVLLKDGECVTRYDTAHGFVHRDVLGRKNAFLHKEVYNDLTLKEGFRQAKEDLSANYARYYEYYETH
jgi:hypothetical protein